MGLQFLRPERTADPIEGRFPAFSAFPPNRKVDNEAKNRHGSALHEPLESNKCRICTKYAQQRPPLSKGWQQRPPSWCLDLRCSSQLTAFPTHCIVKMFDICEGFADPWRSFSNSSRHNKKRKHWKEPLAIEPPMLLHWQEAPPELPKCLLHSKKKPRDDAMYQIQQLSSVIGHHCHCKSSCTACFS